MADASHPLDILKRCACGRSYTRSEWEKLPLCGFFDKGKGDPNEILELRTCVCKSTLALDLGNEPDSIGTLKIP